MISDNKLIKISLVLSIVGLAAIFFSSQYIIPETVEISEISENNIGQYLSIEGSIKKMVIINDTTFLDIDDGTGSIKGIIFERNLNKEVFEGDLIKAVGNIEIYKKEVEIIIKKLL